MTLHENDPRLTAYALGELDAAECNQVEAYLRESEAARQSVEQIRAVANLLTNELANEPYPVMSDDPREAVEHRAAGSAAESREAIGTATVRERAHFERNGDKTSIALVLRRYWIPTSLAASILMVIGAWAILVSSVSRSRELAQSLSGPSNLKDIATVAQLEPGEASRSVDAEDPKVNADEPRSLTDANASRSDSDILANHGVSSGIPAEGEPTGEERFVGIGFDWWDHNRLMPFPPGDAPNEGAFDKSEIRTYYLQHLDAETAANVLRQVYSTPRLQEAQMQQQMAILARSAQTQSAQMRPAEWQANAGFGKKEGTRDASLKHSESVSLELVSQQAGYPQSSPNDMEALQVKYMSAEELRAVIGILTRADSGSIVGTSRRDYEQSSQDAAYLGGGLAVMDPQGSQRGGSNSPVQNEDGFALGMDALADAYAIPTESYARIVENPFLFVEEKPLSTFSIDVDTACYANVRRMLNQGQLPPPDALRIEELVNYFDYDYPPPTDDHPFSVNVEVSECPWNTDHRLARVGIKGIEYEADERPTANLVFLIDVSGSMQPPNRLPLLKDALRMMVGELRPDDTVAIVVYAGASGLVLPATSCRNKQTVLSALDNLQPGGSTNGAAGIQLAYDTATENFIEGGINRVILATDGDFNVGITNRNELTSLIEEKAKTGVFLSVLGVGMGNLKDATLEQLADKGNGNYAYIDTIHEAQKVLVDQLHGTLVTIAKDVKIQVEFNPAEVAAYRLIGYENRMLAARDFNDDAKDAGEIGAGHTVTAFYEIVPVADDVDASDEALNPDDGDQYRDREGAGASDAVGRPGKSDLADHEVTDDDDTDPGEIDPLRYTSDSGMTAAARSGELMTVKLRYKQPDEDISTRLDIPVVDSGSTFESTSDDFAFAAAVVSFGMLLRGSARGGEFTLEDVAEMAKNSLGEDAFDYRAEFVTLVERAKALSVAPASNR